jgi:hypothetical protein
VRQTHSINAACRRSWTAVVDRAGDAFSNEIRDNDIGAILFPGDHASTRLKAACTAERRASVDAAGRSSAAMQPSAKNTIEGIDGTKTAAGLIEGRQAAGAVSTSAGWARAQAVKN